MRADRRTFLTAVTGLAVTAGVAPAQSPRLGPDTWDLAWLDGFKGKHKQVFDLVFHTLRPNTLSPPANYLDVHHELSGLEFPDVNVAVGSNGPAFPMLAVDDLWVKFTLGERSGVKDAETGQPSAKNPYAAEVRQLQARGAVFWMCNRALNSVSADLAKAFGRPVPEVYAELRAGFLPGVKLVPAHSWTIGAIQERGFTYERL